MARKEGQYNKDYGVLDMYKFYKDTQKEKGVEPMDLKTYRKVIKYFNEEVCKSIVEESNEFRLPFRLGYLRIRKFKQRIILNEEGKLKTRHLKPDWVATKNLWERNEKAKENKKIIYHINKHSNGYYYKWYWDKRTCNVSNSSAYSLVMTRANKRSIPKAVKANDSLDYYE